MDEQWHYSHQGSQFGPVSTAVLHQLAATGELLPGDLIWKDGMIDWVAAGNVQGLFPAQNNQFASSPRMAMPQNSPPPMRSNRLQTGEADIVYAGLVRRFAALFVDGMILIVPVVGISMLLDLLLGIVFKDADKQALQSMGQVLGFLAAVVVKLVYFAFQECSPHQATFGKRVMDIKVTDDLGRRLTLGRAVGRYFASALSYLTIYIGFLMAGFTERKRALHDMVAGTLVVDRWAYTEFPERQQHRASGFLIAAVVGFAFLIPIGSILAAIAISQYQDYVIRSQVSEGASLADGVKTAVGEFANNTGRFPPDNTSAGLAAAASIAGSYVSSVDVGSGDGTIIVTYSSSRPQKANPKIDGKTLLFEPSVISNRLEWRCKSSDLDQKWCPSSCECGG